MNATFCSGSNTCKHDNRHRIHTRRHHVTASSATCTNKPCHHAHLQQCGRWVTPKVVPELVDFVQQDDGIRSTGALERLHHDPGHAADVGTAVTADLCHVTQPAKRHAVKLPCKGRGNRSDRNMLSAPTP